MFLISPVVLLLARTLFFCTHSTTGQDLVDDQPIISNTTALLAYRIYGENMRAGLYRG